MLTWEEQLSFIAKGFSYCIFIQLTCPADGEFRTGIAQEQQEYLCPVCAVPCKIAILADGVTRKSLPLEWEKVAEPLVDILNRAQRRAIASRFFLTDRRELLRSQEAKREHATWVNKALKRGRGLTGPVDLRQATR